MELGDMATWVGACAGVLGAATGIPALILNWLTRRDLHLNSKPVVMIAETGEYPRVDGWSSMRLTLRSRSNLGFTANEIRVMRPASVEIAGWTNKGSGDDGAPIYEALPASRVMPINLTVTHAGIQAQRASWGMVQGSGEEHHLIFLCRSVASSSLISVFRRWSARSDSSQILRVSFMVRVIDQNAVVTAHKRTATLTQAATINPATSQ